MISQTLKPNKTIVAALAVLTMVAGASDLYAQDAAGFAPPELQAEAGAQVPGDAQAPLIPVEALPAETPPGDDAFLVPMPQDDTPQAEIPEQDIGIGLPMGQAPAPIVDMTGQDVPLPTELPDAVPQEEVTEDLFFDAEALVPQGEMGRKAGPQKVNPRTQPGSRFVIVRENHAAGSKVAQLTGAERAMKLGRYDSALEIYDRLYAANPRDPNVLMGRAVTLQHMGRYEEAISAYDEMLTVRPDNLEAQINMLGMMAGQYPAVALKRLSALSQEHPQNIGIVAQMAFIHAQMKNYGDAIRYLGMAAGMEPRNANHIYNMAVIADKAGSKVEAVRYYEQALEVDTLYGAGKSIPREQVYERLARIR